MVPCVKVGEVTHVLPRMVALSPYVFSYALTPVIMCIYTRWVAIFCKGSKKLTFSILDSPVHTFARLWCMGEAGGTATRFTSF